VAGGQLFLDLALPGRQPVGCQNSAVIFDQGFYAEVPPQHGAGRDQPVRPQRRWQQPAERGEDGAAGPVQPGLG
jgi:hypothetical protein